MCAVSVLEYWNTRGKRLNDFALVGDIGGTNARFALVKKGTVKLEFIKVLACADYENFNHAVSHYYQLIKQLPAQIACVSFACPIAENIEMTNNHWQFNVNEMRHRLGLKQFELLNDFTAMAYGMLFIDNDDKVLLQAGSTQHQQAPRLVIGPGTGLGVASLIPIAQSAAHCDVYWQAVPTEGGHISFAPQNALQISILQILQRQYSRVSVERILSGAGIVVLYQALCEINQSTAIYSEAAEITAAALADADEMATLCLTMFCQILAEVTGDMVLAQGARGGVFLCGGIPPRIKDFLVKSGFTQAMAEKGRFSSYLSQVPVWLCDAPYPGLLGAAAALKMQFD